MRIDWWTLALQTINVLVLVWILGRFLFRPVAAIVADRQEQASKLLANAAAARQQAEELRAELEQQRAGIAAEQDKIVADAHKAAQAERTTMLARAHEEMAKLRAEADSAISRDRAAMEKALIDRARDLSVAIARRLLERLTPETAVDVFLGELCRQMQSLSPQQRAALSSASERSGSSIEVVTAAPLSVTEIERVRAAISAAWNSKPTLTFRSDPAVIAGIELHGRNVIVRSSWRGDLERIKEELSDARRDG